MDRDDDGNATIDGKFWYFPNYATEISSTPSSPAAQSSSPSAPQQ